MPPNMSRQAKPKRNNSLSQGKVGFAPNSPLPYAPTSLIERQSMVHRMPGIRVVLQFIHQVSGHPVATDRGPLVF